MNNRKFFASILALLLCADFSPAQTTGEAIAVSDELNLINLEKLVNLSDFIMVAHKAEPFRVPHIMTEPGYQPYETIKLYYVVEEMLYPRHSSLTTGDKLVVFPAGIDYLFELDKDWQKGLQTMSIFDMYISNSDLSNVTQYILFLRYNHDGYEFTVQGAYESLAKMTEIKEFIHRKESPKPGKKDLHDL